VYLSYYAAALTDSLGRERDLARGVWAVPRCILLSGLGAFRSLDKCSSSE